MSEQMIARWNAIPLESPSDSTNLKRQRPEQESDDDHDADDIPLVSRSPSPASQNNDMDVDEVSIQEYVRKPAREVITVDTKIKPSNKGFALLTKLGWQEGQPVGLSADGRTEPVPFYVKSDLTGLGKTSLDFQMIEATVSQRRELGSERQRRETEEQRKVREGSVARKFALEAEISSTLKSFYCELCDKQFKTVAQYDEHTNSYAHHHKARFKDMQANNRVNAQELDKRKEKERKREEKELRKMAAANGIKLPKTQTFAKIVATDLSHNMDVDVTDPRIPEKNGSGPNISPNIPPSSTTSSGGFKRTGWTTVGTTTVTTPQLPATLPSSDLPPPAPTPISPLPQTSFRNAGWTTLETDYTHDMQASHPSTNHGASGSERSFAPVTPSGTSQPSSTPVAMPEANPVRSNWQHFQKGRRK